MKKCPFQLNKRKTTTPQTSKPSMTTTTEDDPQLTPPKRPFLTFRQFVEDRNKAKV